MTKQYATLTAKGLRIDDEETLEKFRNKMLDYSIMYNMLQCPAQWAAEQILTKFTEQDLDKAMTRGSLFHRVMEMLFAQDKNNRGKARAMELAGEVLEEKEFSHFRHNEEALEWLDGAIDNYFAMGSKPENVDIANYKGRGGIEIRVIGNIEGCERQFHGFIDRLSYGKNGGLIIDDWKTGATTKRYNPKDRYESGWAEARQQILYAYIINNEVKDESEEVKKARLVFPVTGEVVSIDLGNETYKQRALKDVSDAEKVFNKSCEDNLFEYKKQFLCHWCPLVKACPGGMSPVRRVKKAIDAYNSQPDIEELSKGLKF